LFPRYQLGQHCCRERKGLAAQRNIARQGTLRAAAEMLGFWALRAKKDCALKIIARYLQSIDIVVEFWPRAKRSAQKKK
jgi:hypothetical protein